MMCCGESLTLWTSNGDFENGNGQGFLLTVTHPKVRLIIGRGDEEVNKERKIEC